VNRGSRVNITHLRSDGRAYCTCQPAIGRDWTRERARQHVEQTGHTCRYVVDHITVYEPLTPEGTP
jgi:hypothetical protein